MRVCKYKFKLADPAVMEQNKWSEAYDVIIIDEVQDSTPATLNFVSSQANIHQVTSPLGFV